MPMLNKVKMQRLKHVVHETITGFNNGNLFTTSIVKLDDCEHLKSSTETITAINLDVKNFEFFVLEGARAIINKYHPLIYTKFRDNENRQKSF